MTIYDATVLMNLISFFPTKFVQRKNVHYFHWYKVNLDLNNINEIPVLKTTVCWSHNVIIEPKWQDFHKSFFFPFFEINLTLFSATVFEIWFCEIFYLKFKGSIYMQDIWTRLIQSNTKEFSSWDRRALGNKSDGYAPTGERK